MTKDLSKKLCEIVGIEPRERCIYYTGKEACKLNIPHSACVCECAESGYIYPDFGEPENILKLLNIVLKIGINEVCDFQLATMSFSQENYFIEGETFEEIWLNCLLCELEPHNPDSWERKYSEMLKQAIREAGWKYE